MKGGRLVAEVMAREGFVAIPAPGLDHTPSMITAVRLGSRDAMVAFCRGIQLRCPVGSYISPEPGASRAAVAACACSKGRRPLERSLDPPGCRTHHTPLSERIACFKAPSSLMPALPNPPSSSPAQPPNLPMMQASPPATAMR